MKGSMLVVLCVIAALSGISAGATCSSRGCTYDSSESCQCNSACTNYKDCCDDFCVECQSWTATSSFSSLAECVWKNDANRIAKNRYSYNEGPYLSNYNTKQDLTDGSLFTAFDSSILSESTFAKFVALMNNYNPQEGQSESISTAERNEINSFISAVMNTKVMQATSDWLIAHSLISSKSALGDFIERAWFEPYYRQATDDSSGFEHVFLGEWKSSSSVNGFHNWVQYYVEESSGDIDYHGYTGSLGDNEPEMLGLQFAWGSQTRIKTRTSIAFGVSPEFELALFTAAFLQSPGSLVTFEMNAKTCKIQTYNKSGDNTLIGSAYFAV